MIGAYVVYEYCGSIWSQISWHRHERSLGLSAARLDLVETVCSVRAESGGLVVGGEVQWVARTVEDADVRRPRVPR